MSLRLLMTRAASVKRATIAGGKRGTPVAVLTGIACTPLYPADAGAVNNLLMQIKSDTPYRILETFVAGKPDIRGGDLLAVDGETYTVRAVAEWEMPGGTRQFTHLLVEELPNP